MGWKALCLPKEEGDIGMRRVKDWNDAVPYRSEDMVATTLASATTESTISAAAILASAILVLPTIEARPDPLLGRHALAVDTPR